MTAFDLKTNLHKAIDEITDISILEDLNIIVDKYVNTVDRDFWDELSEDEKREIDEALNESEDEKNLIPHNQVMSELKKWSTK